MVHGVGVGPGAGYNTPADFRGHWPPNSTFNKSSANCGQNNFIRLDPEFLPKYGNRSDSKRLTRHVIQSSH